MLQHSLPIFAELIRTPFQHTEMVWGIVPLYPHPIELLAVVLGEIGRHCPVRRAALAGAALWIDAAAEVRFQGQRGSCPAQTCSRGPNHSFLPESRDSRRSRKSHWAAFNFSLASERLKKPTRSISGKLWNWPESGGHSRVNRLQAWVRAGSQSTQKAQA